MLPRPRPRKSGMSRSEILKPLGSLTSCITQKTTAASTTLMQTTWMGLKPYSASLRTKMPMLPQKIPAKMMKAGPKADTLCLLVFMPQNYGIIRNSRLSPELRISTALHISITTSLRQRWRLFLQHISCCRNQSWWPLRKVAPWLRLAGNDIRQLGQ